MADTHTIKHQLDNEYLTQAEYDGLVSKYSQTVVDGVIRRILGKPYHGCLNVVKISAWCAEQAKELCGSSAKQKESKHADQLMKLARERLGD